MSDTEEKPGAEVDVSESVDAAVDAGEPVDGVTDGAGASETPVEAVTDELEAVDEAVDETSEKEESEEELSDLDEDQFNEQPLDDEVYTLKSHRRSTGPRKEPEVKERKRIRKTVEIEEPQEPEEEVVDEKTRQRREIEAKIDAALKPSTKRQKRLTGDDLEQMQDETIAQLRDTMRTAALQDVESIREGQPALAKLKMLPEVTAVLRKHQLADSILDGNLLESVRVWLEPLPDASLPSFEIQKELFNALMHLPIKTIHLRESGLGKVVLFYRKSKRPHLTIKRAAEKLVGDWTRPIMGRSDNYRDRQVQSAVYDPSSLISAASSSASEKRSLAEESAIRRGRAAIPTAKGVTYQVAPMNMTASSMSMQRPSGDSQLRRMKNKLMTSSRSKNSAKKGPSVEGNNLV